MLSMKQNAASKTDNIRVAIRLRPMNDKETRSEQFHAWQVVNNSYIHQVDKSQKPLEGTTGYAFGKDL